MSFPEGCKVRILTGIAKGQTGIVRNEVPEFMVMFKTAGQDKYYDVLRPDGITKTYSEHELENV